MVLFFFFPGVVCFNCYTLGIFLHQKVMFSIEYSKCIWTSYGYVGQKNDADGGHK